MDRGERWHRRTEERRDIAGGAIKRYREGKRERGEITASNKHTRDVFVPGDLQTSYFFMTNICLNANILFYDVCIDFVIKALIHG